jgi:hypothetical protein
MYRLLLLCGVSVVDNFLLCLVNAFGDFFPVYYIAVLVIN